MQIRNMTAHDVEAVIAVVTLTDDDDAGAARRYYEGLWDKRQDKTTACTRDFVYVDASDRVIAIGGVQKDDEEGEGVWWMSWWYVDPRHQNQGIGTKLLERCLDCLADEEARKLYVDLSALPYCEKARCFYAKHGFVEEGRLKDFYADGEDMIIMGKVL